MQKSDVQLRVLSVRDRKRARASCVAGGAWDEGRDMRSLFRRLTHDATIGGGNGDCPQGRNTAKLSGFGMVEPAVQRPVLELIGLK
jgi:hypothetical protein